MNTVRALIERAAQAHPHAVYALATEHDAEIDFLSLLASCKRMASLLDAHQVGPGETVSLIMPNGLATLRVLLGAMWAGRCVNPINLLSQPDQMRYVLEHSQCRLVFVSPEWENKVRDLLDGLDRQVRMVVVDPDAAALPGEKAQADAPVPSEDAMALLMYTSGTTGKPKGVMLSHANLVANAHAIAKEHALTHQDRVLGVLPLYHINAFLVTMLTPLASMGSVAMTPKFSAVRFWSQVQEKSCTWINVVPTIVSYLLEGSTPPAEGLRAVRFCRSASAALPPEHLQGFETKFGIGVIETMGLTETAAPSFSNPLEPSQRKLGSVGRASGCEARVIDSALQPVPDGSTGEIAIRGPNVMQGYFHNEQATKDAFTPDGWLRTGDLGHRDADGFFFVTGRIKELIIKGGENISPREIDEALLQHPAVLEAAAVGIADRHYGQDILACIVLREGHPCDEDNLRAFCLDKLGKYKTPKTFRFVSELPRGPSGKVQRLKLLDLIAA